MAEPSGFKINASAHGRNGHEAEVSVVSVAGEIDLVTSQKLDRVLQKLLSAGAVNVVVDLRSVSFVDASGVGVLLGAASEAKRVGGSFVVRQPSPLMLRVFDILRLDGSLPIDHDRAVQRDESA